MDPRASRIRSRLQVRHDLVGQLGASQDRQQLRCPPRRAIVTLVLAGGALAHVACHGQPQGGRQHHGVTPGARMRVTVTLSVSQDLL